METGTEYSDIQDRYLAGEISDSDASELYQKYGGMKQDEAEKKVQKMACERDTGIKYDDIQKEYVSGNLTEAQAGEMLSTYGGVKDSDRADTLKKWQCEKDTGVKYDDIRESYIDGDITESKAREMLVKYGGKKQEDAEKMVREYQCEKDTGITYDEIREAYTDGEINRNKAISMWTKYGDMDREDAESKADLADFVKANPELEDISEGAVQKYNESCKRAGISASTFYNTWKFKNDNSSDYDSNGKTTVSLWDKVTQYIDKQRLSSAQKDALYCAFYSSSTLYKTPWH